MTTFFTKNVQLRVLAAVMFVTLYAAGVFKMEGSRGDVIFSVAMFIALLTVILTDFNKK